MKRPRHRPAETHCRICGTQLEVEQPARDRGRGLFGRRKWQMSMVCPKCGATSGYGQAVYLGQHPPRNPIMKLLQLKRRRRNARAIAQMRRHNPFVSDHGRVDLVRLLEAVPFSVYGLNGRPLGLRLMSPGWGGEGTPTAINRVHFGYIVGHPDEPEKAVWIDQHLNVKDDAAEPGTAGDLRRATADLSAVENLIRSYASREHREEYFYQRDFHRDWNMEKIQKTRRQQAVIQVGDTDTEVHLAFWDEPQRVILAHLTMEENTLLVAAVNTSWKELQEALNTLVVLQEDQQAVADHQQDVDEVSRQLKEYHDKYLT